MSSDPDQAFPRKVALQVPYIFIKKPNAEPKVTTPAKVKPVPVPKSDDTLDTPVLSHSVETEIPKKPQLITFDLNINKLPTFTFAPSDKNVEKRKITTLENNGRGTATWATEVEDKQSVSSSDFVLDDQPLEPSLSPVKSRPRRSIVNYIPPCLTKEPGPGVFVDSISDINLPPNLKRGLRANISPDITNFAPPSQKPTTVTPSTNTKRKASSSKSKSSKSRRSKLGIVRKRHYEAYLQTTNKKSTNIVNSEVVTAEDLFNKHAKKSRDNKIEIPLEHLKASEIEALMEQYQGNVKTSKIPTLQRMPSSNSLQRCSIRTKVSSPGTSGSQIVSSGTGSRTSTDRLSHNSASSAKPGENWSHNETPNLRTSGRSNSSIIKKEPHLLQQNPRRTIGFRCNGCEIEFTEAEKNLYSAHFKNEHKFGKSKQFSCPFCTNTYTKIFNLNQHMKSHTLNVVHTTKRVISKPRVQEHPRPEKSKSVTAASTSTKIKKYKPLRCHGCRLDFTDKERLLYAAHFKTEHKVGKSRQYHCMYCTNMYMKIYTLNHHMKLHIENEDEQVATTKRRPAESVARKITKKYKPVSTSKISNPAYKEDREILKPIRSLGSVPKPSIPLRKMLTSDCPPASPKKELPEKYECNICGKLMKRCHKVIFVHHQTHKQTPNTIYINKGVECTICHERFVGKEELRNHLVVHLKPSEFKCKFPNCGCSYSSLANLNRHIRTKKHR